MRELHNAISGSGNTSEMGKVEIWFHEDCISWMADIRLVGHVILGIFWPNQYYQFLVITTLTHYNLCILLYISLYILNVSGLEDAIISSRKALCFKCKLPGSTLGCTALGCRELAHFHCAKAAHWSIDEHIFQARCSRHKLSQNIISFRILVVRCDLSTNDTNSSVLRYIKYPFRQNDNIKIHLKTFHYKLSNCAYHDAHSD